MIEGIAFYIRISWSLFGNKQTIIAFLAETQCSNYLDKVRREEIIEHVYLYGKTIKDLSGITRTVLVTFLDSVIWPLTRNLLSNVPSQKAYLIVYVRL